MVPPHCTAEAAPQLHVVHARVSSAPVYSVRFVPNGHATSPACVAQSWKPLGTGGAQRSPVEQVPWTTGSAALQLVSVFAHVSGGTFDVGCAAQLPPETV
jgi:hypothetical protein